MNTIQSKTYYDYLAFFRVFLAFHIFKKYVFYLPYMEDLFGKSSFHQNYNDVIIFNLGIGNEHGLLIITIILALSVLMAFGVGKNVTVLLLFITVDIIQRLNGYLLNGGDNFLKFILLYMAFVNSFTRFALSPKPKITDNNSWAFLLHKGGLLSIKIHLCLIYFISGLAKANAKVWYNGVATYYTLNLERFAATSYNKVLSQNGYFVTLSTYATLLWELAFPLTVWISKLRIPTLVLGLFFHLGIYFLMMIHDFEILFMAAYGLFISDSEWSRFYTTAKNMLSNISKRLLRNDEMITS